MFLFNSVMLRFQPLISRGVTLCMFAYQFSKQNLAFYLCNHLIGVKTLGFWKTHLPTPAPLNITKRSSKYSPGSTNTAIENPPCSWHLPGKMRIFPDYLSLPEYIWTNLPWTHPRQSHGHSLWQHSFDRDIPSSGGISPTPCDDNGMRPILTSLRCIGAIRVGAMFSGKCWAEGKNRGHPCLFFC